MYIYQVEQSVETKSQAAVPISQEVLGYGEMIASAQLSLEDWAIGHYKIS